MRRKAFIATLPILFLLYCFPNLERSPLETVNILSFLSGGSTGSVEPQDPENPNESVSYPLQIQLYSMAYGEIQIRHMDEEPIRFTENSTVSIALSSLTPTGTLDFRIISQPTDHNCRIVNPNASYREGLVLEVNCFSLLNSTPVDGGIIAPTTSIVLEFSDSTNFDGNPDSSFTNVNLEAGGTPSFLLSQNRFPNDTLTVEPGTSWNPGIDKFVGFLFQNADGKPLAAGETTIHLTVASTMRYVSTTGNDANDGQTPSTPLRNIHTAISQMAPCSDKACLVLVEEGSYDAAAIGDFLQLEDGISLHGSYTLGSNFELRNPGSRNSIIEFQSPSSRCGNVVDYCAPIFVPLSVTDATIIEGFTIQSTSSFNSFGLYINRSSPRIVNNTIRGGDISIDSGEGGGIFINEGGSPIIDNSRIVGGNCTGDLTRSMGIRIYESISGATITPDINDSVIQGGDCLTVSGDSIGLSMRLSSGGVNFNQLLGTEIRSGDATRFSIGLDSDIPFTLPGQQNIFTGNANAVIGIRNSYTGGSFTIGNTTENSTIELGEGSSISRGLDIIGTSADLTVNNLTISMGNTYALSGTVDSYGMYVEVDEIVRLIGNTISMSSVESGDSNANAYGIYVWNENDFSVINRNTIQMANLIAGNSVANNYGVFWEGTNEGILSNTLVYGGSSNLNSYGVYIFNNILGTRIYHNTIASGTGLDPNRGVALGVMGLDPTKIMIRNNIFLSHPGMDICMEMNADPPNAGSVQSNVFYNCTYLLSATRQFHQICGPGNLGLGACTTPATDYLYDGNGDFIGNRNIDPLLTSPFVSPFDFNPTAATPCSISRDTNVIAGSSGDRFSNPRPSPNFPGTVSLGAIQYEGACVP